MLIKKQMKAQNIYLFDSIIFYKIQIIFNIILTLKFILKPYNVYDNHKSHEIIPEI